jgi:hypothetical protein
MNRIVLAAAGLAAVFSAGALAQRADAAIFGNPAAVAEAANEMGLIENVHCRPGRWHHRSSQWRRADGCRKGSAVIVVPGRERYVIRDGVRVRIGSGDRVRSRTTIRSGRDTTVRRGTDTSIRTGTDSTVRTRSDSQSDTGTRATTRSRTTTGGSSQGTNQESNRPGSRGDSDGGRQAPSQQSAGPAAR